MIQENKILQVYPAFEKFKIAFHSNCHNSVIIFFAKLFLKNLHSEKKEYTFMFYSPPKLTHEKFPSSFYPPVFLLLITLFSCTKLSLSPLNSQELVSSSKVAPNVLVCNSGYHWDYYWRKCITNCPTGYHNDSITGACVPDGGNPPIIISYAGVNISYYSNSHLLSFKDTNDVNTVLDQLDADYENYNTTYENQYPNFSALQLDSLDSVKNFDQLQSYKNFEAKFVGYTSQRRLFENNETTWLNNNTIGADPDSLDYTVDNSENAICNNNYQLIIGGTTYQWTSTGLITVGGAQSAVVNSPTGPSCFSNYRGGPAMWVFTADKKKVQAQSCS